MPRRPNPLDPRDGPVAAFAYELRLVRDRANGPTYRQLASQTNYSHVVLSRATSGKVLPSWEVTKALVTACGGDVAAWQRRWEATKAAVAVRPSRSGTRRTRTGLASSDDSVGGD